MIAPWIGARSFRIEDADRFCGRQPEIYDAKALLAARGMLTIFGPSGVGKSSLIEAGVGYELRREGALLLPVARLRAEEHAGEGGGDADSNIFTCNVLRSIRAQLHEPDADRIVPNADELAALIRLHDALSPGTDLFEYGQQLRQLVTESHSDEDPLRDGSANQLIPPRPIVLVIDQFEELFTHHLERWRDREPFIRQLRELAGGERQRGSHALPERINNPPWLLLGMREDYLGNLRNFQHTFHELERNSFRLGPLSRAAALEAIQHPAARNGYRFEPGVPEELLNRLVRYQTRGREIEFECVEPVQLQVVCARLAQLCRDQYIRHQDLRPLGNFEGVLRDFYENGVRTVVGEGLAEEIRLRRWFDRHLVTDDDLRRPLFAERDAKKVGGLPRAAVNRLSSLYLVRAEPRDAGGELYEITHDRLVRPIARSNREWLQRRRDSRLRRWVLGTAAAAVILLLGLGSAWWSWDSQYRHWQSIESQIENAHKADDPALLFGLLAEHLPLAPTAAVRDSNVFDGVGDWLHRILDRQRWQEALDYRPRQRMANLLLAYGLRAPELAHLLGHAAPAVAGGFDAEGYAWTVHADGQLVQWQGSTPRREILGPPGLTSAVKIAIAPAAAGGPELWFVNPEGWLGHSGQQIAGDAAAGSPVMPLPEGLAKDSNIGALAVSRRGDRLAAASCDRNRNACRLFYALGGDWSAPVEVAGMISIDALAFSPDGLRIAIGGCSDVAEIVVRRQKQPASTCFRGGIVIHRIGRDPEPLQEFREGAVTGLAYLQDEAPEAELLVVAGAEGRLSICDARRKKDEPPPQRAAATRREREEQSPQRAVAACDGRGGTSGSGFGTAWARRQSQLHGLWGEARFVATDERGQVLAARAVQEDNKQAPGRVHYVRQWHLAGALPESEVLGSATPLGSDLTRAWQRIAVTPGLEQIIAFARASETKILGKWRRQGDGDWRHEVVTTQNECISGGTSPPRHCRQFFRGPPLAISADGSDSVTPPMADSTADVVEIEEAGGTTSGARRGPTYKRTPTAAAYSGTYRIEGDEDQELTVTAVADPLQPVVELFDPYVCDARQDSSGVTVLPWRGVADLDAQDRLLAVVDSDRCLRVYRFANGFAAGPSERLFAKLQSPVSTVGLDETGQRLAVGTADGSVYYWNSFDPIAPGEPYLKKPYELKAAEQLDRLPIRRLAFAGEGCIVTVDFAGRVFLWDVSQTHVDQPSETTLAQQRQAEPDGDGIRVITDARLEHELKLHNLSTSDVVVVTGPRGLQIVSSGVELGDPTKEGRAIPVTSLRRFALDLQTITNRLRAIVGDPPRPLPASLPAPSGCL